jgi:hypothetical protein
VGTWHTPRTSGPTLKSLVQREAGVEVLMDDGKRAGPRLVAWQRDSAGRWLILLRWYAAEPRRPSGPRDSSTTPGGSAVTGRAGLRADRRPRPPPLPALVVQSYKSFGSAMLYRSPPTDPGGTVPVGR